jgi:hypothetical protein
LSSKFFVVDIVQHLGRAGAGFFTPWGQAKRQVHNEDMILLRQGFGRTGVHEEKHMALFRQDGQDTYRTS